MSVVCLKLTQFIDKIVAASVLTHKLLTADLLIDLMLIKVSPKILIFHVAHVISEH